MKVTGDSQHTGQIRLPLKLSKCMVFHVVCLPSTQGIMSNDSSRLGTIKIMKITIKLKCSQFNMASSTAIMDGSSEYSWS